MTTNTDGKQSLREYLVEQITYQEEKAQRAVDMLKYVGKDEELIKKWETDACKAGNEAAALRQALTKLDEAIKIYQFQVQYDGKQRWVIDTEILRGR